MPSVASTPNRGATTASGEQSPNGSPSRAPPAPQSDRALFNRVGLINQGATCYLNSMLQVLFHLPYFRSAVYRCVGDDASAETASLIPAALQELFFQLQECNHAPKTEALTKSFGWSDHEVMQQHDIHELLTLLRDELESRMKGTPSQGALNKLFEGKVENVIATLDGSYVSRRPEVFFDIQLEVVGHRSVMDSLRSQVKKDQLTGDNKYKVEEEGKPAVFKDAEKGLTYTRFPPVLCFHLKRFEMDMMSPNLDMRKINDRFEFSATLDLRDLEMGEGEGEKKEKEKKKEADGNSSDKENDDEANALPATPMKEGGGGGGQTAEIDPNAAASPTSEDFTEDVPPIYDLHSVIIHKGSVNNGHYYCYVREVKAARRSKRSREEAGGGGGAGGSGASITAAAADGSGTDNAIAADNSNTGVNRHVDPSAGIGSTTSITSTTDGAGDADDDDEAEGITATTVAADLDFEHGQWYEFDDDHIRRVTEQTAIFANFGGRMAAASGYGSGGVANNNAYMLTYIRRGYWPTVMRPTPTDEIPRRVKEEFRRVMAEEDAKRRAAAEEATRCYINVVDDSHCFEHVRRNGFEVISPAARSGNINAGGGTSGADGSDFSFIPGATDSRADRMAPFQTLVLHKKDLFSTLYDQLQDKLGYDKNTIRLRTWEYHYEQPKASFRPSTQLVGFDECQGTIESVLVEAGVVEGSAAAAAASAMGGGSNGANANSRASAAASNKAFKLLIYVEQKRIIPIAPAPAASLGEVVAEGVMGDQPPAPPAETDDANTNNTAKGGANKSAALVVKDPTPLVPHDGSYSMNLFASEGASLIVDAITSSQHDPRALPPANSLRALKPVSFEARDPKPSLTFVINKPRVLSHVVLRLGAAKSAPKINYMVYADVFASAEAFRSGTPVYRMTPQTTRLPTEDGAYQSILVLSGDDVKFPQMRKKPVNVIRIVVTAATGVPTLALAVLGVYADAEAEVALVKKSRQLQVEHLQKLAKEGGGGGAKNGPSSSYNAKALAIATSALSQLDNRQPQLSPSPVLPAITNAHQILLMIKGYSPNPANGEHIRFLGPMLVDSREPLAAYTDVILHLMGIPIDRYSGSEKRELSRNLRFYEEQKASQIIAIDPLHTMQSQQLLMGNCIIVERAPTVTSSLYRFPSIASYWAQHMQRVFVNVRLRDDPMEPLFQCYMDRRWAYHQVCECIATKAAEYLILTNNNGGGGGANSPTGGGAADSPTTAAAGGSPRDKLNASLASTAFSKAGGGKDGRPLIDADKIVLYAAMDAYTTTFPSPDPVKCTSKAGATLRTILLAHGGRYASSDLFFDILPIPRLQAEQRVQMRAVIADENGEIYTDELPIMLPIGARPSDLVQAIFSAARATEKVRERASHDRALCKLATKSEAFCLVGTRDNRIISLIDNILLATSHRADGSSSASSSDDEDDEEDEEEIETGSSSSGSSSASEDDGDNAKADAENGNSKRGDGATTAARPPRRVTGPTPTFIKPRCSKSYLKKLVRAFPENNKVLDPALFTSEVVYQLRPINLLSREDRAHMRMYIGFCDCPHMQYTRQAPLFNTPIVITITQRDTLSDVWAQLQSRNPEILKGARDVPQKDDGLCIKLVMFTTQALSFNEWDRTPVADYFTHTANTSGYRPMLCINRSRPKEAKGPRFGSNAEPKLRLGAGTAPTSGAGGAAAPPPQSK